MTHYQSSKGPVRIADMNPHHLAAAHAKLVRQGSGLRASEIAAMAAQIAEHRARGAYA